MKIHEHQSKQLLRAYGIPVPRGGVANSVEEALSVAREMGGSGWVVKAQIHAGGRGKGGGIRIAPSLEEVATHVKALLGSPLITPQTGPEGKPVRRLLIEEQVRVRMELYAGVVVDRGRSRGLLLASSAGGMGIEELSHICPEGLRRELLDSDGTLHPYQARRVAFNMGLPRESVAQVQGVLQDLCRAFHAEDCSLAEINPLVITQDQGVLALDAKLNLDDNAAFRHPEWREMRDLDEEDPLEQEASRFGLNYIKLNGSIGCMVNGAGLAMATMDLIKEVGGEPANFLDVGGGATEEAVSHAFRILMSDPNVRAVLINIFGGIMRCDVIARGVLNAASAMDVRLPIVVRLEGTHAEEGRRILAGSHLALNVVSGLGEAAARAVELGRQ